MSTAMYQPPVAYCKHDWRLWTREWEQSNGGVWHETWYCTRCRLIDERIQAPGR